MRGPRDYSASTRAALFAMANGTCYAPGCATKTVVFVDRRPVINVELAHINGAYPGSPRYDATMTDQERAAFANLVLLCHGHHQLVDRIDPDGHPADLLAEWKRQREGACAVAPELDGVTEAVLSELLEAIRASRPRREVTVLVRSGLLRGNQLITGPIDNWTIVLEANPSLTALPVIAVSVRNTGALGASVQAIELNVHPAGLPDGFAGTFSGRDDFPSVNPTLPRHLDSGDAITYVISLDQLREWDDAMTAARHPADRITVRVRIGSGEDVVSPPIARGLLPT